MSNLHTSKLLRYEEFLNEKLKNDLKKVLDQRDALYADLAEYLQLQTSVEKLKAGDLPAENMKTQVDLGCNFYVQAKIPSLEKIYVKVGFGFFVPLTFDETLAFVSRKAAHLNQKIDRLSDDANSIKAHIKLVLEGLRELQGMSSPQERKHRDVWS